MTIRERGVVSHSEDAYGEVDNRADKHRMNECSCRLDRWGNLMKAFLPIATSRAEVRLITVALIA